MADRSDLAAPEAERALVGAILVEPALATRLLDQVDGTDFYDPRHETLWDTYAACVDAGADPDLVTVTDRLRRHKRRDLMAYLPDLVAPSSGDAPSLTQVDHYVAAIVDYARRRRLQALGARLEQAAFNGTDPVVAYGNASDFIDAAAVDFMGGSTAKPSTGRRDLSWVATGRQPDVPGPAYGRREDDVRLFYAARVNGIFGKEDAAKTWLALAAVVEALTAGERAAIIDVDHNGQDMIVEHLLLIGAYPDHLGDADRFYYAEPDEREELLACVGELVEFEPKVAVLDSLGEVLPMVGAASKDNDEITAALRAVVKPLANAHACVITIDHQAKAKDAPAGYAIGGTAKKRAIDGTLIHVEKRAQFAPGHVGKSHLQVEKDRPGRLIAACGGKWVGVLVLDSRDPNISRLSIKVTAVPTTDTGDLRPTRIMERASRWLEDDGRPRSGRDITKGLRDGGLKARTTTITAAIARLVEEGYWSAIPGDGRAVMHSVVAEYREGEDNAS